MIAMLEWASTTDKCALALSVFLEMLNGAALPMFTVLFRDVINAGHGSLDR